VCCINPASKGLSNSSLFGGVGLICISESCRDSMDIQARVGSITSRSFVSRKHSFSTLYLPLRLLCSRRNFQQPQENDNNNNKGRPSFATIYIYIYIYIYILLNLVMLRFSIRCMQIEFASLLFKTIYVEHTN
jgi:hypothetical protein